MRLELRSDGYARIEAAIQDIDNIAWLGWDSVSTGTDAARKFQEIVNEVRKLRQTLREVVIIDPKAEAEDPPEAA
jgi:uncharacterized protein YgfB (UPF0149 family)